MRWCISPGNPWNFCIKQFQRTEFIEREWKQLDTRMHDLMKALNVNINCYLLLFFGSTIFGRITIEYICAGRINEDEAVAISLSPSHFQYQYWVFADRTLFSKYAMTFVPLPTINNVCWKMICIYRVWMVKMHYSLVAMNMDERWNMWMALGLIQLPLTTIHVLLGHFLVSA